MTGLEALEEIRDFSYGKDKLLVCQTEMFSTIEKELKAFEIIKEFKKSEMFKNFNDVFVKIINKYKPLYMIAYYDMYNMMSLTGIVSDNYEEIKKIYDEKYAWKPNQMGVTEYHYEIVKINVEIMER